MQRENNDKHLSATQGQIWEYYEDVRTLHEKKKQYEQP